MASTSPPSGRSIETASMLACASAMAVASSASSPRRSATSTAARFRTCPGRRAPIRRRPVRRRRRAASSASRNRGCGRAGPGRGGTGRGSRHREWAGSTSRTGIATPSTPRSVSEPSRVLAWTADRQTWPTTWSVPARRRTNGACPGRCRPGFRCGSWFRIPGRSPPSGPR